MTTDIKHPKARVLAYYLPQFHPIPENDVWWGKGFTEWTNVGKAKPLFPGHYQPHVPADLGYYDLRVPETREAQAEMARKYGVEGFVYWHYWFAGKRLIERPFNEVLESGKPDFPFALAWANETWRGFGHGLSTERQTLIEQTYPGDEDYIAHFNAVLPAFKDKRYITCEGKPIFVIYQAAQLPDAKHFIELWQELARKNGLKGIYLIAHEMEAQKDEDVKRRYAARIAEGFDAVNYVNKYYHSTSQLPFFVRVLRFLFHKREKTRKMPNICPYDVKVFRTCLDKEDKVFPSILPNWDHTPRSGLRGTIVYGSTPEKFGEAVKYAVEAVKDKPQDKQFVFIKSWNEWAEGNYMEPDLQWGCQYLEQIAKYVL